MEDLKACVRYFYQYFNISPNDSPSKTEKYFLFHQKSSFSSRDIQICVYSSSPLFSLSAIALEVDSREILKFMTSSAV